MSTKDDALKRAQEYAAFAIENLTLVNWKNQTELDVSILALQTYFLFPTLTDANRALLAAAHLRRRGVRLGIGTLNHQDKLSDDIARQMDVVTRNAEESFMDIVTLIRSSEFIHSLTELQMNILETEYLTA